MKPVIRKAGKTDFPEVIKLIIELAHFEKLSPPTNAAKTRLYKDSFGKNPKNNILVALIDGKIVGYAFYFYTYSSFLARKTLYLEDIYISEKYRKHGTGRLLFKKIITIARKNKCGRMEWCVLDWNINAIKFYNKLGAKPLKEWIYYRMNLTKTT